MELNKWFFHTYDGLVNCYLLPLIKLPNGKLRCVEVIERYNQKLEIKLTTSSEEFLEDKCDEVSLETMEKVLNAR